MSSGRSTRESRQEKAAALRAAAARAEARRRTLIVSAVAVVVIVLIVAVFVLVQSNRHNNAVAVGSTPGGFDGNDSVTVGAASAPVTVIAYEDFQCPICRAFEQANSAQLAAYVKAGKVKIQYRPISFLDRESSTDYSTRALNAAAAVVNDDPAAFAAFHQLLFTHQPAEGSSGLTNAQLIDLAVQAGAPRGPITTAVTDETYKGWTVKVTDDSSQAGVTGTPTVRINGKTLTDPSATTVKATIDADIVASK